MSLPRVQTGSGPPGTARAKAWRSDTCWTNGQGRVSRSEGARFPEGGSGRGHRSAPRTSTASFHGGHETSRSKASRRQCKGKRAPKPDCASALLPPTPQPRPAQAADKPGSRRVRLRDPEGRSPSAGVSVAWLLVRDNNVGLQLLGCC
ncbi:unnamed protein product [Rangifer tarandus platyrhynchus]|uniref:Uncharacterized protein n=1 Tax=Rangifer tarandus platyrhynchus TaxID=3082113 RepID=A0AC59YFB2_RANTA